MSVVNYLIAQTGLSGEVIRFGLALFSSFPLSALFLRIPATNLFLRHSFSIISTGFLTCYLFRVSAFIELLALCVGVYVLAYSFKSSPYSPLLIFTASLAHMAYLHLENQLFRVNDPSYIDYSSMMMVLLIKTSSFGFNVNDGTKDLAKLDEYQKAKAVKEIPTLIEFLGYCFFFNGVWVGPAIDYNHYISFIESSAPYNKSYPRTISVLKCLVAGIAMLVLEISVTPYFHFSKLGDLEFTGLTFVNKVYFLMIAGVIVRAKFYAVWKVSEASALISGVGIGTNAEGAIVFNACENVSIVGVELGENVKVCFDAWNKFTANWLRRYVYDRVPIKSLRLPLTFFISAFWHGFYPGYYLSFLFSVPLTECGRSMRRNIRPLFREDGPLTVFKLVYDALGSVLTLYSLNTLFLCFIMRDLDKSYGAWREMYFSGLVLFIVPVVVMEVFGAKKLFGAGKVKKVKKVE